MENGIVSRARLFVTSDCHKTYKGAGTIACIRGAKYAHHAIQDLGVREGAEMAAGRCETSYPDVKGSHKFPGQLQDICKVASNTVVRIVRRGRKKR